MNKMLIGLTGLTLALSACGSSPSAQSPSPAAQTASVPTAVQTQALGNTYSGTLAGITPSPFRPSFVNLPGDAGFSYSGGTLKATLTTRLGYLSPFLERKISTGWQAVSADPDFQSSTPKKVTTLSYTVPKGQNDVYSWFVFNKREIADDYTLVEQR